MNCPQCGDVEHQPIPDDEAHCRCQYPNMFGSGKPDLCECACHEYADSRAHHVFWMTAEERA